MRYPYFRKLPLEFKGDGRVHSEPCMMGLSEARGFIRVPYEDLTKPGMERKTLSMFPVFIKTET